MLKVHRTDTDEIVLIHEATQTVVVGDSFDAAFEKLRQLLGERLDDPLLPPAEPASRRDPARATAWARYALLAILVALPFVWLAVLHTSLGSLAVELRRSLVESKQDETKAAGGDAQLREDLDGLGRRVDRLIDDVSKLKRDAKRRPSKPEPIDDEEDEGDDGPDAEDEPEAKAPTDPATDAVRPPSKKRGAADPT